MAGFSFASTPSSSTSGGFPFNAPAASATPSSTGFSFLTPSSTSVINTTSSDSTGIKLPKFSLPTTSAGASGFSFNLNTATTTSSTATTSASTLFNSNTTSAPSSSGFSFGLNATKPTTAVTPSIPNTPTTSNVSFSFTGTTSATPSGSLAATSTTPSNFGPIATLSTATSTTSFGAMGAGGATNLSMRQLEERLNKWLVELKEQEERFLKQAAHVNAWDQILQNGHEQVQSLKDTLHTVKSDQYRLEAEIDFIRGQQDELERLLEPLESATNANPSTQLHQGDRQRDNMYYLAQSLDAQLRQMTEDLGKVIEHLNTNSGSMQPNDPVNLVARILSAHMDTLKWVDQNITVLSQKMDDVARVSGNLGKRG